MKDTKPQQRREAAKVASSCLLVLGCLPAGAAIWWFLGSKSLIVFGVILFVDILVLRRRLTVWMAREKADQDYEDLVRDINDM